MASTILTSKLMLMSQMCKGMEQKARRLIDHDFKIVREAVM